MNREEIEKLVEESANQARKHRKGPSTDQIRKVLNTLFLIAAVVGLVCYFAIPENRWIGLGIVGGGMILKVIEFFIRFMF